MLVVPYTDMHFRSTRSSSICFSLSNHTVFMQRYALQCTLSTLIRPEIQSLICYDLNMTLPTDLNVLQRPRAMYKLLIFYIYSNDIMGRHRYRWN